MTAHLGLLDFLVLCVSLAATILIGLGVSRRTKSLESYLLGDRNLPWWAILFSIVATETSAATVLSVPGEAFGSTGMKFLQLALGYVVGRAIIVQAFLPLYFQGKLFTAYEVLDRRFGGAVKQAASLLFIVTRNFADGLRLFLAAVVLQNLAGWSFSWCVVVMGVVTIVYTYVGGMRSVVWNDCLQFAIYMLGAIAAVFVLLHHIPGGWTELESYLTATDKSRFLNLRWDLSDPYTLWAGLLGGAVLTLGTHGTDQMMVQRFLSARSQREAGVALFLSGLVVFLQFALFCFIGVALACYYSRHPEITFAKGDQVFPDFIVRVFPRNTGLVGLMLAAILVSTLSSSLNSLATAAINDFSWGRRWQQSPDRQFALTRNLIVVFGIVQMAIGFWAREFTDTVVRNALTIAGFSAGLLLGIFALGALNRRAGQVAALVGSASGLGALLFVQFGLPALGLPKIAFPWLALIGATTTLVVGSAVSLVAPRFAEDP